MSYRNMELPDGVSPEWVGGAGFHTSIVRMDNGRESRNIDLDHAPASYVLRYNALTEAQRMTVDTFFHNAHGKAYAWKLRDPRHNVATTAQGRFTVIDSTHAQLVVRYTTGAYSFDRIITKPDATTGTGGTVAFTGGSPTSLDVATGILTHAGIPTNWSGKFFICVRFDVDELEISGVAVDYQTDPIVVFNDIPIVEDPYS